MDDAHESNPTQRLAPSLPRHVWFHLPDIISWSIFNSLSIFLSKLKFSNYGRKTHFNRLVNLMAKPTDWAKLIHSLAKLGQPKFSCQLWVLLHHQ